MFGESFAVAAAVAEVVVVVVAHSGQLVLNVADVEGPATFDVNAEWDKFNQIVRFASYNVVSK